MLILKLYNFQSTAIKTVSRWRAWKYYTAVATCQSDKTEVVSLVAIQDFLPSTWQLVLVWKDWVQDCMSVLSVDVRGW